MSFCFILTRHVNSSDTNQYWNLCIQHIRRFYPNKIVVIDDKSDEKFIKQHYEYKNVEIIYTDYPARGELLPYYYYYIYKFADNALIIHDSVFIAKKLNLQYLIDKKTKVMPLWHFSNEKKENIGNTNFLLSKLKNNHELISLLNVDKSFDVLGKFNTDIWMGCFGCQSFINYNYLSELQTKYNLFNLLNFIKCRSDRCCFERVMGLLFFVTYLKTIKTNSMLGDIHYYCTWNYSFKQYCDDNVNRKKTLLPIIKIWSGR
jgi:hypothetical protein